MLTWRREPRRPGPALHGWFTAHSRQTRIAGHRAAFLRPISAETGDCRKHSRLSQRIDHNPETKLRMGDVVRPEETAGATGRAWPPPLCLSNAASPQGPTAK